MVRVLLSGVHAGITGESERETPEQTAKFARRLRDGGHEVVVVGSGVSAADLAATAVQEDVVAIALAEPVDAGVAMDLPDALTAYGAGDVVVFAVE